MCITELEVCVPRIRKCVRHLTKVLIKWILRPWQLFDKQNVTLYSRTTQIKIYRSDKTSGEFNAESLFQITPSYLSSQNLWKFILLKFLVFFHVVLIFIFSNTLLNTLSSYDNSLCFVWVYSFLWQFKDKRNLSGKRCWRVWERHGKWDCRKLNNEIFQGLTPHQILFRQYLETRETGGTC